MNHFSLFMSVLLIVLLMTLAEAGYGYGGGSGGQKVLLTDVQVLTLKKGAMTHGQRSAPIPQLTCVRGNACHRTELLPEVVQCYNRGSDGIDVQWECKADLDGAVRFGTTTVSCEGYNNADDPYVLQGSCGLEYELLLTEAGRKQQSAGGYYGSSGGYHQNWRSDDYHYHARSSNGSTWFWILVIGFGLWWFCARQPAGTGAANYGNRAGGDSGYDGGPGGGGGGGGGGGYGPGCGPSSGSSQPGFWSGLGMGGLLGSMFGRRSYGGYGGGYGGYYNRPGWGFGGGGRPAYRSGGFFGGGGSSFGGGGGGGARSTSGFGGTRRR